MNRIVLYLRKNMVIVMKVSPKRMMCGLVCGLTLIAALWLIPGSTRPAHAGPIYTSIVGKVTDEQQQPIAGATIEVFAGDNLLHEVESQENGLFAVDLDATIVPGGLNVEITRSHFESVSYEASEDDIALLLDGGVLNLHTFVLERRITAGFWVATITFAVVLALIAFEVLHNTTATLLGVGVVFVASFILTPLWPDLYVFDFERALTFIDFEVIFLIMGMMIVIGIIEGTGVFQWLTYRAYQISRGRAEILVIILMIITSIASALLDNVTTMLLMTPITLQIALALGINPLSLLLPEVLASNVGGISTLVGTPTNIMIGSFADISFTDFLINLTPGVLVALVGLAVYVEWRYRDQYKAASARVSPKLEKKLAEEAQITGKNRITLIKSGIVFVGMLILFVVGEQFHLVPAVTALIGATAMLIWVDPDVESMLRAVDWTTLVFFMTLFILVGAVREVGMMSFVAMFISGLVGGKLSLGMIIIVWLGALISMMIANIPFTAAMLPVIGFLTRTIPGAESKALFYSLSVGSAMGGNGSLIGASANVVTAGISGKAGYKITFVDFFKVGFPSMLITVAIGMGWLLIRF
jgi:Na+/H+ antiporter NhaD/arsenite permease-like protein